MIGVFASMHVNQMPNHFSLCKRPYIIFVHIQFCIGNLKLSSYKGLGLLVTFTTVRVVISVEAFSCDQSSSKCKNWFEVPTDSSNGQNSFSL